MCEAFQKSGIEVELIIPERRKNSINTDPFLYYQVDHRFRIRKLYSLDWTRFGWSVFFILQNVSFALSSLVFLIFQERKAVVYTRGDSALLWPFFLFKKFPIFIETHFKSRKFRRHLRPLVRARGIVVVTKAYRRELTSAYHIPANKIIWAPDGVDLAKFSAKGGSASGGQISNSKFQIRERLGIPQDKKIIVYTGTDLGWRGVETFKEAVRLLPQDWRVYFVGSVRPIDDLRAVFIGHKPPKEIPLWLSIADALVLCGTAKSEISLNYVSPLKLFEYLAAGRPIVAVDTPSHREILSEENALLVKPDDPEALAKAIKTALTDEALAEKIARNAATLAPQYSWDNRANRISDFISSHIH